MRALERTVLTALALGGWVLVVVLVTDPLDLLGPRAAGQTVVAPAAADTLHPDPQSLPERDVPERPQIEAQLRRAITGCRIEGEVAGARWSGTIRC